MAARGSRIRFQTEGFMIPCANKQVHQFASCDSVCCGIQTSPECALMEVSGMFTIQTSKTHHRHLFLGLVQSTVRYLRHSQSLAMFDHSASSRLKARNWTGETHKCPVEVPNSPSKGGGLFAKVRWMRVQWHVFTGTADTHAIRGKKRWSTGTTTFGRQQSQHLLTLRGTREWHVLKMVWINQGLIHRVWNWQTFKRLTFTL